MAVRGIRGMQGGGGVGCVRRGGRVTVVRNIGYMQRRVPSPFSLSTSAMRFPIRVRQPNPRLYIRQFRDSRGAGMLSEGVRIEFGGGVEAVD